MMQDKRLKRPERLADGIVSDVTSAVGEGRHTPGQKLPTESEMAAEYGVSRAVVREAIAQLKADGMVSVRQGAGAFIAAVPGASSFKITPDLGSDAPKLRHLFELRLFVEGAAASLAAMRRQAADLEEIENCLRRMTSALDLGHDGSIDEACSTKPSPRPRTIRNSLASWVFWAMHSARPASRHGPFRAALSGSREKQLKNTTPSSGPLWQATAPWRATPRKIISGTRKSERSANCVERQLRKFRFQVTDCVYGHSEDWSATTTSKRWPSAAVTVNEMPLPMPKTRTPCSETES
jgi:hypothetical protein